MAVFRIRDLVGLLVEKLPLVEISRLGRCNRRLWELVRDHPLYQEIRGIRQRNPRLRLAQLWHPAMMALCSEGAVQRLLTNQWNGTTIFEQACRFGYLTVARQTKDPSIKTGLISAAHGGQIQILEWLCSFQDSPEELTYAFYAAIEEGQRSVAEWLYPRLARPLSESDLQVVCVTGQGEIFQWCVEQVSVEAWIPALRENAIGGASLPILQWFQQWENMQTLSALETAIKREQADTVEWILQARPQLAKELFVDLLFDSVQDNQYSIVRSILARGYPLLSQQVQILVRVACQQKNSEMVELLRTVYRYPDLTQLKQEYPEMFPRSPLKEPY